MESSLSISAKPGLKEFSFNSTIRGLITTEGGRYPLTLHGCALDVTCKGYATQVKLQLEYINETECNKAVMGAYPLPFGWLLQECAVMYDGNVSRAVYHSGGKKSQSYDEVCSSMTITPSPDLLTLGVVAQSLPFVVRVGTSALMNAVYCIPHSQGHPVRSASSFILELSSMLFPTMQCPHDTVVSYNRMFTLINATRYLQHGVKLNVSAELPVALRGPVRLERIHGSTAGGSPLSIPLECKTEYFGDCAFHLQYTAPLEDLCTPNRSASLLLSCDLLNTREPLRIFVERDVSSTVADDDKLAVVAYFTPNLYRSLPNVEVILVCDGHSPQSLLAMADSLHSSLRTLPNSVYFNVIVLSEDKNICLHPDGAVRVQEAKIEETLALIASTTPQKLHQGDCVSRLPQVLHGLFTHAGCFGGGPALEGYLRHIIVLSDEAGTEWLPTSLSMIGEALDAALRQNVRVSAVALTNIAKTAAGANVLQSASGMATLRLLAEEGGGAFRVAHDATVLSRAIAQVFAACTVETLTNIQVELEADTPVRPALPVYQQMEKKSSTASSIAAVPCNNQHLLFFLAPADTSKLSLSITGKVGDIVHEFSVSCDCAVAAVWEGRSPKHQENEASDAVTALDVGPLHVATAESRLRYIASLTSSDPENVKKEAIRLSETFSLPSLYTSLVSSDVSLPATTGTYLVPPQIHYLRFMALRSDFMIERSATPLVLSTVVSPFNNKGYIAGMLQQTSSTEDYMRSVVNRIVDLVSCRSRVKELFTLQSSSGAFSLNDSLGAHVGIPLRQLSNARPEACGSEESWATLVAFVAMRASPSSQQVILSERAAALFLDANHPGGTWRSWIPQARELLQSTATNVDEPSVSCST
ncbi:unnamed protein product, partial [Phytomonas sp. EM1]